MVQMEAGREPRPFHFFVPPNLDDFYSPVNNSMRHASGTTICCVQVIIDFFACYFFRKHYIHLHEQAVARHPRPNSEPLG